MVNGNSDVAENALRVVLEIFIMLVQHRLGKGRIPLHKSNMMYCLLVAYEQRSVKKITKTKPLYTRTSPL